MAGVFRMMADTRAGKVMKWTMIGAIIGEAAGCIGFYCCYRKMRDSQDFRKRIYDLDHRILNTYYDLNTKFGNPDLKYEDAKAWGIEINK